VSRCNGCSCTFFVQTKEGDRPVLIGKFSASGFDAHLTKHEGVLIQAHSAHNFGAMVSSFDEGSTWLSCCVHEVLSDIPISSCLLFQFAQLHISRAVFLMHVCFLAWKGKEMERMFYCSIFCEISPLNLVCSIAIEITCILLYQHQEVCCLEKTCRVPRQLFRAEH